MCGEERSTVDDADTSSLTLPVSGSSLTPPPSPPLEENCSFILASPAAEIDKRGMERWCSKEIKIRGPDG
jgi:hypothetical protein